MPARAPGRLITTDPDTIAAAPIDAETDEAPEPETGPLRRCIVTRERLPKERMIRFVVGPDRALVPDLPARLPGRGIWLSASADVIEPSRVAATERQAAAGGAALTRAFARAARGPVIVPPDLSSVLQAGLVRRVGELLGLARRAGQAVAGFQKAREWVQSGRAGLVVQASDGSPDERARLLSGAAGVCVTAPLTASALGAVFGRDHAVHVAVARGRLADALAIEAARLAGLRGESASDGRAGEKIEPCADRTATGLG